MLPDKTGPFAKNVSAAFERLHKNPASALYKTKQLAVLDKNYLSVTTEPKFRPPRGPVEEAAAAK